MIIDVRLCLKSMTTFSGRSSGGKRQGEKRNNQQDSPGKKLVLRRGIAFGKCRHIGRGMREIQMRRHLRTFVEVLHL